MDIEKQIIKNELKQDIKADFNIIVKQTISIILKNHNVSPTVSKRIIKDILVWANITIDNNLN